MAWAGTAQFKCNLNYLCNVKISRATLPKNKQVKLFFFLSKLLFVYRDRGREAERGRGLLTGCLLHVPQPGTWPTAQACSLTWNQTGDLSLRRMTSNPLSLASQGKSTHFLL